MFIFAFFVSAGCFSPVSILKAGNISYEDGLVSSKIYYFNMGPYIYDIQKKCPIFLPPSSLFLSVQMGQNWARLPPWKSKLRLPTTPLPAPSPLVFLQKTGTLKTKPKCCLKPSVLQNQTPVCLEH